MREGQKEEGHKEGRGEDQEKGSGRRKRDRGGMREGQKEKEIKKAERRGRRREAEGGRGIEAG